MQVSPLAVRMKAYEAATGAVLPAQSWAVLRLDGKAFHTYTRNLRKPFDYRFLADMTDTMKFLCEKVEGAVFGYTQSDEISIMFSDLGSETRQKWFGGKVQKIVSVSAGYAAAKFNSFRVDSEIAVFDSRVFTVPSKAEVIQYLRWRQQDSVKNAVFMAASKFFTHKQLLGKSVQEKILMLEETDRPWSTYDSRAKLGAQCLKVYFTAPVSYTRKDTGEVEQTLATRSAWQTSAAMDFQEERLCEILS